MIHTVPWIRTHGTQILQMDLAESTLQFLTHSQVDRKLVGSKFTMTGKDSQHKGQDLVHGSPYRLEKEQQSDNGGDGSRGVVKSKGSKKIVGGIAQRENVKGSTKIDLGHTKIRQSVS